VPSDEMGGEMSALNTDDTSGPVGGDSAVAEEYDTSANSLLAVASVALSGLGFFTLLSLADRRDRTPAKALGLFFTTSFETITGTVLGFVAVNQARRSQQSDKGLFLGATGAVLGIMTTVMNFNWMRTRRRI
jgi:hypothetical protein